MDQKCIGMLLVTDGERYVGIITDRDIAVRAVGRGLSPDTPVQAAMTSAIYYSRSDQNVEEVLDEMAHLKVRRLPVIDAARKVFGVISITDLATNGEAGQAGRALGRIGEAHRRRVSVPLVGSTRTSASRA